MTEVKDGAAAGRPGPMDRVWAFLDVRTNRYILYALLTVVVLLIPRFASSYVLEVLANCWFYVILALGLGAEEAHGSLRLSLGRENTQEEADGFLDVFPPIVDKLRSMSPLYSKG